VDLYHALQCQAMLSVLKPDRESWLRHVLRWYSKAFHTPLHEVSALPVEDVLTAFYEDSFEAMEDAEREDHLQKLLETEEQRAAREKKEAAADRAGDDMFDLLNQQVQEDVDKGKLAPKYVPKGKNLKSADAKGRLARLGSLQTPSATAEPGAPSLTKGRAPNADSEVVTQMNFDDGGNLLGQDPLARPPKKKG
jgi:hypothetical protein